MTSGSGSLFIVQKRSKFTVVSLPGNRVILPVITMRRHGDKQGTTVQNMFAYTHTHTHTHTHTYTYAIARTHTHIRPIRSFFVRSLGGHIWCVHGYSVCTIIKKRVKATQKVHMYISLDRDPLHDRPVHLTGRTFHDKQNRNCFDFTENLSHWPRRGSTPRWSD
jgi:hypothetical protein